jgi:hypothetical protein
LEFGEIKKTQRKNGIVEDALAENRPGKTASVQCFSRKVDAPQSHTVEGNTIDTPVILQSAVYLVFFPGRSIHVSLPLRCYDACELGASGIALESEGASYDELFFVWKHTTGYVSSR